MPSFIKLDTRWPRESVIFMRTYLPHTPSHCSRTCALALQTFAISVTPEPVPLSHTYIDIARTMVPLVDWLLGAQVHPTVIEKFCSSWFSAAEKIALLS